MTTVTEITRKCTICDERKSLKAFATFRDSSGQINYGFICSSCSSPISAVDHKAMIAQTAQDIYSQKLDNFAIQQTLAENQRVFGEVTPPEAPEEPSAANNEQQLFAGRGNEYGLGGGGAEKVHPILSNAAQFQGESRKETPNAPASEAAERELQNRLENRLENRNENRNTPRFSPY